MFGREGASGGIGDGGHAFGPGQFNDAGGVWTGRYPGMSPQQKNALAWTPAGLRELATRVAAVAAGLHGRAAITRIVTGFERPLNPAAEIAGALAAYGGPLPPQSAAMQAQQLFPPGSQRAPAQAPPQQTNFLPAALLAQILAGNRQTVFGG